MKIPVSWLKEYVDFDLTAEQVATKLTMGGLEVEGIEESAIGPVLDVYVTPNRGDCLSVIGVAREVAALLGSKLNAPKSESSQSSGAIGDFTSITIEDSDLCPRYAARVVEEICIGPSPAWLCERLEAAGQRAVNNVVDVTNYVMLELGQPLHAFDLDRLSETRIVVRQAHVGETIETLDGEKRQLSPPMLVIADAHQPIAIAGLMGGAGSEVSDKTTRILLESAHFDPLSVRRTSRALSLRTEASYRFERVVDPHGVVNAVNRCVDLLHKIGLKSALAGVIDVYPHELPNRRLTLRANRASELLGMQLDAETCSQCLSLLGFGVSADRDFPVTSVSPALIPEQVLTVTVPSNRADISIEEDLIEEVGRIYGYDNIPETLPAGTTTCGGDSQLGRFLSSIRHVLSAAGMREVITHSLTGPSRLDTSDDAARRVAVRNALSTSVASLRRSLLPALVDIAQSNSSRGQHNLAIFEVGRVWQNEPSEIDDTPTPIEYLSVAGLMVGSAAQVGWRDKSKSAAADYFTIKAVVDRLLDRLHITGHTLRPISDRSEMIPQLHPGRSATISLGGGRPDGVIGELHPTLASSLDIRNRVYLFEMSVESLQRAAPTGVTRYKPVSRQQAVTRDIAPRVLESVTYAAVSAAIRAAEVTIVSEIRLTDLYRGAPLPQGVKSLTISLTFIHQPTSLTDDRAVSEDELNDALTRIRTELEARCGAEFAA